ncbi:MAG: hypothetical protein NC102_09135 [Clostridium sp.]|nr:hypothetical protein [Clostridium sp.]
MDPNINGGRQPISPDAATQYQKPQQQKPQRPHHPKQDKSKRTMLGIIAVLLVIILGAGVWFAISMAAKDRAIASERQAREQAELDREQALMNADFDDLNRQFSALEGQRIEIRNDSLKRELSEKYQAAKMKVEKLQQELKNQKAKSSAEIKKLKDEIATLRAILKDYVAQIAKLNEENKALRAENEQIKNENTRLSSQVQQTSKENEKLNERMTLAEKLNVTGVSLTALNKKGKTEKKVSKAKQLMVTFTIPQNNSTPVGEKVIYLRLISPSGQLLGGAGVFPFEGANVECTAKKSIEYAGEEIAGINIYWDVTTALTPGSYTVELFTEGYRLTRRAFEMK